MRKPKNEAARRKAHLCASIDSLLRPSQKATRSFNPNSLRSLACRSGKRWSRRSFTLAFANASLRLALGKTSSPTALIRENCFNLRDAAAVQRIGATIVKKSRTLSAIRAPGFRRPREPNQPGKSCPSSRSSFIAVQLELMLLSRATSHRFRKFRRSARPAICNGYLIYTKQKPFEISAPIHLNQM